ncbi:MAG TPA: TlpA disulfide reductase family protein [Bacteroidales bacterium]|nr:TlpA disulfide reductase family protein [Bacteroidales bacterium]
MMQRYFSAVILLALITGCSSNDKVIIRGTFNDKKEGKVYLEQSEIDNNILIDSAAIKRGRFSFKRDISGPEFFQVGVSSTDFVSLLAMPGDNITLSLGNSPLVLNYSVEGSAESEKLKQLDETLFVTLRSLDSLKRIYSSLSTEEMALRGAELENQYIEKVNDQRKKNIVFILDNIASMSSLKALYQRIDENTYVLYQPRDLQFLKIVSDSLSVKYPASRHILALSENVSKELNQMYVNRLASIASKTTSEKIDPDLPDTEGQRVKLSSLRGKYVLVSFWSSTSQSCMEELPALKSLYKMYNSKGLEIYQVSLDPDANRWKNVVRYEDLPWISVREDDSVNPPYSIALNITQIPSNLLYDREGNIINSNLFGRNLQIKMDQLFNK